jgi:hypothetical protein
MRMSAPTPGEGLASGSQEPVTGGHQGDEQPNPEGDTGEGAEHPDPAVPILCEEIGKYQRLMRSSTVRRSSIVQFPSATTHAAGRLSLEAVSTFTGLDQVTRHDEGLPGHSM